MATGITGKQIRDDTITGSDIAENTLIIPTMYHSSGNHNSTAVVYLALPGRNGWSGTFQKKEHQLIAPYNGKVIKVLLRPTTGDGTACTFQVRTNQDGNTIENGETDATINDNSITANVDEGTTEVIFETGVTGDGPKLITKGHAFGFSLFKSGTSYGITDAVIVIEWDLSS